MNHLESFSAHNSKYDLLREVFEELDPDYDIKLKVWKTNVYNVNIKFDSYPDTEFTSRLIELTKMAEGYCQLEFMKWTINSLYTTRSKESSLIDDLKWSIYSDGGYKLFDLRDLNVYGISLIFWDNSSSW